MADRATDLQRLIEVARAKGLDETQTRELLRRYDERGQSPQPAAPPVPAAPASSEILSRGDIADRKPMEQWTLQDAADAAPAMLSEWGTTVAPAIGASLIAPGILKYGGPIAASALSSPIGGALLGGGVGYATGGPIGAGIGILGGFAGTAPVVERARRLFGRSAGQRIARGMSQAGRAAASADDLPLPGPPPRPSAPPTAPPDFDEAAWWQERLKNARAGAPGQSAQAAPEPVVTRPAPAPAPQPAPATTPPAPADDVASGMAKEAQKREASYLDREYEHLRRQRESGPVGDQPTGEDYIARGAVSKRASEAKNLGDDVERVQSYEYWKAKEQAARNAGDIPGAEYANKRARQRLHVTKKTEELKAKRAKKGGT